MKKTFVTFFLALAGLCGASSAFAVDGCEVMLCMAGNWRHISACVPPVTRAIRDAARGHSWPTCHMSSGGSAGSVAETSNPTTMATCPAMYREFEDGESGPRYIGCRYQGVVQVTKDGLPYTTMYWDAAGNSVTEFSAAAKADLRGDYDHTYDDELAAWLASHPTPEPPDGDCPPHMPHCVPR